MQAEAAKRYRAFISYSQHDRAIADRLHKWLEAYRVPLGAAVDLKRARLGRFFRDEAEMGASSDLAATLRSAIEDSESLIVLCSPKAASSEWVDAEVQHFRSTGRGKRVFAVIVSGTPNSGNPATECFPPSLQRAQMADGGMSVEPLALDLRREGRPRICARLAAGLLDATFDDLWRRDRRNARSRTFALVTVATLVLSLALGVLSASLAAETVRATLRDRTESLQLTAQLLGDVLMEAATAEAEESPTLNEVAVRAIIRRVTGATPTQRIRAWAVDGALIADTHVEFGRECEGVLCLETGGLDAIFLRTDPERYHDEDASVASSLRGEAQSGVRVDERGRLTTFAIVPLAQSRNSLGALEVSDIVDRTNARRAFYPYILASTGIAAASTLLCLLMLAAAAWQGLQRIGRARQ